MRIDDREWLEPDGLGGFASGTVSGVRTRRYHALLLAATTPPTGRVILVNGFDAWLDSDNGSHALTTQRYAPDVLHPDGASRIAAFASEPWPTWRFELTDGTVITQEIFAAHGSGIVAVAWTLIQGAGGPRRLRVRPFVSGRDYHSTHHENGSFNFLADQAGSAVGFRPYDGVPAIVSLSNGTFTSSPDWYRNFLYTAERERGLDSTEDLASPGEFAWRLDGSGARAVWLVKTGSNGPPQALTADHVVRLYDDLANTERERRAGLGDRLDRAADAYLVQRGSRDTAVLSAEDRTAVELAILSIVDGYAAGTRFGIRMDDGLLAAGVPGTQLTWMDARVGDRVITPRIGKPVEVQALWINALHVAAGINRAWRQPLARARAAFESRFWSPAGYLADVVDVDHVADARDDTFRPNQILAVGGLPVALVDGARARAIVDAVESRLFTPLGLRSLAPGEPGYAGRYEGDGAARDAVYHQGTVWPWLMGAFVDAWLRVHGRTASNRDEARRRFVEPLRQHLDAAGLGHVSEIADAEPPFTPRGCPFHAWSLGELIRIEREILAAPQRPARRKRIVAWA